MKTKSFNLEQLIRPSVKTLKPYVSARNAYSDKGENMLFLDANENPYPTAVNRYPDPDQHHLKLKLAQVKNVNPAQIVLGNGSNEILDLMIRAFCEPQQDKIIIAPPTYGMYETLAHINDVNVLKIGLEKNFKLPAHKILKNKNEKLLIICSPNNPTGNSFEKTVLEKIIANFKGLVVMDEAYIDFSNRKSWIHRLAEFPNLVVVQTFSKAYGNAGIRLGVCYASEEIVEVLNKIKPPYNINVLTQQKAIKVLLNAKKIIKQVNIIKREREKLYKYLKELPFVLTIYPSETNYILVKVDNASKRYDQLLKEGIVVRNRSSDYLCENCLRISIGTPKENKFLQTTLKKII